MDDITWKEFKDKVEAAGVKDTDVVSWIDYAGVDRELRVARRVIKHRPSSTVLMPETDWWFVFDVTN